MPGSTPITTPLPSASRSSPTTRPIRTSRSISYFMCAETDAGGAAPRRRRPRSSSSRCAFTALAGPASGQRRATVNLWDEYEKWKRDNPDGLQRALSGGLIGSPETIRRKLRRFQTSNIDQVILLNQAGKNTHEHICESLELFAREVMPEFHATNPQHQAWKAAAC